MPSKRTRIARRPRNRDSRMDLSALLHRRLPLALTLLLLLVACATRTNLVRETAAGGVVAYTISGEDDILTAAGRTQALEIIHRKCPQGSRIVREGEMAKVRADVDRTWGDQIAADKRWALQFQCN
jgi:hypothetical protein